MNTLCICAKNEIYKIFHRKKYRIMLAVTLGVTVCGALIGLISNSVISFSSQNYPYAVLSLCCYLVIPFTALMLASDLISVEFERNEWKLLLTRHFSRTKVLLGKLAAIVIYELVLTAANVIAALIFSLILSGFTSVNIFAVLMSVVITIIPTAAFVSFAGFLSVLCKSGISAFGLGVAAYGGITLLGLVFSKISGILFTSYLAVYKMIIGQDIPIFRFVLSVFILLGFLLVFISGASIRFEKREF